jgi:hypothetical protein
LCHISNQLPWQYESNVGGLIYDGNKVKVQYLVREVETMVYTIHSIQCLESSYGGQCQKCKSVSSSFYHHCQEAVELGEKNFHEKTTNKAVLTSPTLAQKKLDHDKKMKKSYQNKIFCMAAEYWHKKGVKLPNEL